MYGYSCLKHIIGATGTQATESSSFFDIVTNNYEGLADEVDYLFQYKYRMASIETFYIKECLFGIIMFLFLFKVTNDYKADFKGPLSYVELNPESKEWVSNQSDGMYDFASVVLQP